ncbi:hypothetical protein CspHIS471_0500220 [Cutaneotrichosporon sp. HIS471]|nr:hypothetical protein CspHIS471_0500220 [Cutaneotrichosporon sp. HIS471]
MSSRSPISTNSAARLRAHRAARRPTSPSNLNNIKPWFDETARPTIVDTVVRCAASREQQAFQCTSRYWRKRVDDIRSTHLVLDGELYSDFPRRFSTNLLHDGKRAYFFNEANYRVYSSDTDSDMAFTLPAMDVSRTRVFDVMGQRNKANTLADLQTVVEALDVPVTVVGFDLLERRIRDVKNKLTGVTFVDTRAYRAEVGEDDWALFTREAEGVDLLHRQHIWSDMLHRSQE